MQLFVEFVLVDGNVVSMANVVSFLGVTILVGAVVMMCQALMHPPKM